MEQKIIQETPSNAQAEHATVHIQGPAGIDVSLTPEAALETAKRIDEAAVDAILNRMNGDD